MTTDNRLIAVLGHALAAVQFEDEQTDALTSYARELVDNALKAPELAANSLFKQIEVMEAERSELLSEKNRLINEVNSARAVWKRLIDNHLKACGAVDLSEIEERLALIEARGVDGEKAIEKA